MCPSQFDCGRQPLSWRSQRMPGLCLAELWSVARLVWRYEILHTQLTGCHKLQCHILTIALTSTSNYFCPFSLAVAGTGPVRDVRERPACPEQSSREHPNRSPHLDHCCQVGGGQWQHSDGGQDHWQSHHFSTRQRCGDQQRAVDTGVLLLRLCGFIEKERAGFPAAVYRRGKLPPLNK